MKRLVLALTLLALAVSWHPADAAYIPIKFIPAGGSVQRSTLAITSTNTSATTGNITVVNADFVSVRFLGFNGSANSGTCGDTDGLQCNGIYLTTAKIDSTHITITANRNSGTGGTTTTVSYEVTDVSKTLADAVYRGTSTTGAAFSFTACPQGLNHTDISWLGISGFNVDILVQSGSTTTVTSTGGSSIPAGVQVICWK